MRYQTADLALAAFLLAKQHRLVQVHGQNPRHVRFEFENGDGLQTLVDEYTAGTAMVDAIIYAEKLAEVKSLLWQAKKEKERTGKNEFYETAWSD